MTKTRMVLDTNMRIPLPMEATHTTPHLPMNVIENVHQQVSEYKWRNIAPWIMSTLLPSLEKISQMKDGHGSELKSTNVTKAQKAT